MLNTTFFYFIELQLFLSHQLYVVIVVFSIFDENVSLKRHTSVGWKYFDRFVKKSLFDVCYKI